MPQGVWPLLVTLDQDGPLTIGDLASALGVCPPPQISMAVPGSSPDLVRPAAVSNRAPRLQKRARQPARDPAP